MAMVAFVKLEKSWKAVIGQYLMSDEMQSLKAFIVDRKRAGVCIYPPPPLWFNAFNLTPFDQVKVVIVGQDPYHGPKQAHGLSFSVADGVKFPPSLKNIFSELKTDLKQTEVSKSGDLTRWAKQGVLLMNSILTVEKSQPSSHAKRGWESFTDEVIRQLNHRHQNLVFILWGAYAQRKASWLDPNRHCMICSTHPSPLSAYGGFFGSKPFSKANAYLLSSGKTAIDW